MPAYLVTTLGLSPALSSNVPTSWSADFVMDDLMPWPTHHQGRL